MAKPVKSQWDFGELFPPETIATPRPVLSVTELTRRVKGLLEKQIGLVWVTGEITNLRAQAAGHIYFTLKDSETQLSCVLFRRETQVDRSILRDGRHVNLRGELTVYEARGQYQLRVTEAELQGQGALQAAFERLKQKLAAEGLFALDRKRPLPKYPKRVGVATSATAAALQDVRHVVERRNPALEIVLAPCRVQGEGAAVEIAAAIRLLNEYNSTASGTNAALDLILVTRGGGSIEDLWAFNEEAVARAIYESALPVVSAVGHEIDWTISDFVADVRAATPSAAAEIITENVHASRQFLSDAGGLLRRLVEEQLGAKRDELAQLAHRFGMRHPRRRLDDSVQRLDDLQAGLVRYVKLGTERRRVAWQDLSGRLARVRPELVLKQRADVLSQTRLRLSDRAEYHLEKLRHRLAAFDLRLRLLGPEQVLSRGYSITTDAASGRVVQDASQVTSGQRLKTRLKSGEVQSIVEK